MFEKSSVNMAPSVKYGNDSIMLWDCFTITLTVLLHKIYVVMERDDWQKMYQPQLKSSAGLGLGVP